MKSNPKAKGTNVPPWLGSIGARPRKHTLVLEASVRSGMPIDRTAWFERAWDNGDEAAWEFLSQKATEAAAFSHAVLMLSLFRHQMSRATEIGKAYARSCYARDALRDIHARLLDESLTEEEELRVWLRLTELYKEDATLAAAVKDMHIDCMVNEHCEQRLHDWLAQIRGLVNVGDNTVEQANKLLLCWATVTEGARDAIAPDGFPTAPLARMKQAVFELLPSATVGEQAKWVDWLWHVKKTVQEHSAHPHEAAELARAFFERAAKDDVKPAMRKYIHKLLMEDAFTNKEEEA